MSNILDGEFYDNINNPSKRIAIINTDFTEDDPNWERMKKDADNIKTTLRKLKFADENVYEFDAHIAINRIQKETSNFCTLTDKECPHSGYIMMFNLTYKHECDLFSAGETRFNSDHVRNYFVANNLIEWADKPKFIFYQSIKYNKPTSSTTQTDGVSPRDEFALPIDANIFEAFSNDGDEDSYGDENGSFYIQALCDTINQHIDDQSIGNICINNIMYKVHSKVEAMVGKMGSQTPHFKSTFVKKFVFPMD